MNALAPWTGVSALKREMDRFFDRFWDANLPELPGFAGWDPRVDVSETKDALVVKAEIAGIEPKEIEIALHEDVLTIKGDKKHESETNEAHFFRIERGHGAFGRTLAAARVRGREQGRGDLQERPPDHHAPQGAGGEGNDHPGQGGVACSGPGRRGAPSGPHCPGERRREEPE